MKVSRGFAIAAVVWVATVVFGGWGQASAQTFPGGSATAVHPGVLLSQAQLNYMKIMVQAHQDPFYSAFIKAQNSSSGSLTYVPTGPPAITNGLIVCGSTSNPDYGCSNSDDDGTAAYVQALLWYITGNQTYANNAINIMNYYAKHVVGYGNVNGQNVGGVVVSSSNTPLQAAWDSQKWPRAAEIIRYSNAGWPDADAKAFGQWMKTVIQPQLINGSTSNGNWEISMNEGLMNIGVYNDDPVTFNLGLTYWKQRLPAVFYYHTDGGAPVPVPRGSTNWNGQTVYDPSVDGVQQETCRDFGHAQYSVSGALDAAETAGIQGVNLYGDAESITDAAQGTFNVNAQNRLTSALEFNAYYLLNNPVPTSVCGGTVTLQVYPVDEIGYNEYHNRLGLNLPYTIQYLQSTIRKLSNPTEYHIMVYESLTHGGDASQLQPFLMWTNGSSGTLQSGSSTSYTVTVVPGSATNPSVALSLTGLPSGITYSFSPATVSGAGTSTLTITASITAPSGSYPLNITGTSGSSTFTNPLSLLVNASNANFSITPASTVVSSVGGDVANFPLTLTPINNYVGSVNLSVTAGLPAGASATFSSPVVTNTSPASTLSVLTSGTTPPGAYSLTISGTDGVLTNKTTVLLIVNPISNACILTLGNTFVNGTLPAQAGTFTAEWDSAPSTSLNNSNVGLSLGAQTAFTGFAVAARFNPSGFIDARNGGAFVAASSIPYTAGTSYHFRAVVNVPANTYSLYVTPAGQAEVAVGTNYSFRTEQSGITSIDHWDATSSAGTITLCNMVVDAPNLSVTSSPSSQTVAAGMPAAYTTTVAPIGGYTGTVTLSATGLPSGATASFKPATVAVGASAVTSTMTVTTTATAATGLYPITVTATDGTLTNMAYPELTINPPCLPPTATSQKLTVPENSGVAITLAGTLGSGCALTDTLNTSVTVNPSHGVLTGTTPNLFYTPASGFAGSDSFSFTATDANAVTTTSSPAAVSITVAAPVSGAPIVSSIAPAVVVAGSTGIVLTVNGSGFTSSSTVLWNGAAKTTTYISSTQLTEAVSASDISASGLATITVSTPGTSGGLSAPLTLAVDSNITTALTAMTTSYTVTRGQSATAQLIVRNLPAGALTRADCYNLPAGVNCSYSAQTESLTISTGVTTPPGTYQILVVSMVNPSTTAAVTGHSIPGAVWCGLLGLPFGLMCVGGKRRRWLYSTAGILGLFLVLMVGCSSGSAPTSSATSQASMTLTLTVN